jgi:hypothetical protein
MGGEEDWRRSNETTGKCLSNGCENNEKIPSWRSVLAEF